MPRHNPLHIMIVAGESSGDKHGANLINGLKSLCPETRFTGLGGPLMKRAGQGQLYDIKDLAVLGLTEVLKRIFFFQRVFKDTVEFIKENAPDAVVLIDYPGFNVRLAERIRSADTKVIYYISPQVWAWGKGRVKKIARVIEKMLVVFPFEKDIYEKEGVPVSFVGHPLMDELKDAPSREEARNSFSLNPDDLAIGILPGSRFQEVKLILPLMLKTALLLKERFNARFLLPVTSAVNRDFAEKETQKYSVSVKIVEGDAPAAIKASDLVITASGTATLETAILERPMVIVYKVPFLSYIVLRRIIKVPYIGMANILLREKAFPEFIQHKARPRDIFGACRKILEEPLYREKMIKDLEKIRFLLAGSGGGINAAREVLGVVYG